MDDLSRKTWDELIALRRSSADPEFQRQVAPYEHRAYARETVAGNPLLEAPRMVVGIPAYQLIKALRGGSRTPPSLEQVTQGYKGLWEGLVGQAPDSPAE